MWKNFLWIGLSSGFFSLAFLPAGEIVDSFVEEYISDIPSDSKCVKFPPQLRAEVPSDYKRSNNGPESFHAHFNEQFYFGHPGIQVICWKGLFFISLKCPLFATKFKTSIFSAHLSSQSAQMSFDGFCSYADWFESHLVGSPRDWFSHVKICILGQIKKSLCLG